jgi:acyl dehydratase
LVEVICVSRAADLDAHVGAPLGPTNWRRIDQDMISAFADLTGDANWIHRDVTRAARELAGGRTLVPGHLLLSLLPSLVQETYRVEAMREGRVAALREVRFRKPVSCGEAFRFAGTIRKVITRRAMTFVEAECRLMLADETVAVEALRVDAFTN